MRARTEIRQIIHDHSVVICKVKLVGAIESCSVFVPDECGTSEAGCGRGV